MSIRIFKYLLFLFLIQVLLFGQDSYTQEINDLEKDSIRKKKGNSCVECHKGLKGNLRDVFLEWEKSIHAQKGNKCNICHGGNPNVFDKRKAKDKEYNFIGIPKKKEIDDYCGRLECHSIALFQLKKSPHYKSVLETGEPNCTSCHGKHNIQRSSINIMSDKTCSGCHSVEYSREIIKMVFSIEKDFDNIKKSIDYLLEKNADVWEISSNFSETKHLFHQLVHIFSREEMQFTTRIIDLEIGALKDDLKDKIAMIKRVNLLYVLTIINIIAIISGFFLYNLWSYIRKKK